MNEELEKQWGKDVLDYGNNAYLMWYCHGIRDYPEEIRSELSSNEELIYIDNYCIDDVVKRKKSAALPFDLERAKAGDAVEVFVNNKWNDCNIFPNAFLYIPCNEYKLLRMKYPPKVVR